MKQWIGLLVGMLVVSAAWAKPVEWATDYEKALADAAKTKKIIMIDLYTDWCGWCKKLDKDVYANKTVEDKLGANFIAVKANPEKTKWAAELAKKFKVRGFPYIVFLDAKGNKLKDIGGYVPADKFAEILDSLVKDTKK
jgi:thioredoxin-related protein